LELKIRNIQVKIRSVSSNSLRL